MSDVQDITPEGSHAPVFLDSKPLPPPGVPAIGEDPDKAALRASAKQKLIDGQPLTPEEAAILVGL